MEGRFSNIIPVYFFPHVKQIFKNYDYFSTRYIYIDKLLTCKGKQIFYNYLFQNTNRFFCQKHISQYFFFLFPSCSYVTKLHFRIQRVFLLEHIILNTLFFFALLLCYKIILHNTNSFCRKT